MGNNTLKFWDRMDMAWKNVLTNLGVKNKDKRLAGEIGIDIMDRATAEALYRADDICAKIVDKLPEEMLREGFKVCIPDEQDWTQWINDKITNGGIYKKLELAMKWARLYGGSVIYVGADDGNLETPEKPLNWNAIQTIKYLVVLDRWRIYPEQVDIERDPRKPNFDEPEFYRIVTNAANLVVHSSRVIRFDGVTLPYIQRIQNQYWGDSVLSRAYPVVRDYQLSYDGIAAAMQDLIQSIFKMENLAELVSSNQEELLQRRLELINVKKSILNAVVIQKDEEFKRETATLTGVPETLKMFDSRLVMAADMPHTILFGDSPSGLGATGDSERMVWYDHVRNKQECDLRPKVNELVKLCFAAKDSISNGVIPDDFGVEFEPLFQPTEKDQAETRKIVAETDDIYINNGVLDAAEVTASRWGTGKYSMETTIDSEARANPDYGTATPPDTTPNTGV